MSLFKRKDSSSWWVKIIIDGRKVQRSTGTDDKVKAQEFHDRLKAQMWDQHRLGVKPRRSWKDAVVRWLSETSEKATHHEDKRKLIWLHSFLGELTLNEITLDVIDEIKAAKLKEATKGTTNRYLALVRSILLRARDEWEWVDKVPKVRLFKETASRERSLTREEAGKLLDELPPHQRDVVLFALATGLRQMNVLKLEWSQIDLERRHAWIHALQRAGITDFRWHDLRHTWATWQRQAGTPTHELQRLGGWLTGAMVERYAHLAPDHLASAASRLDSVLAGYDSAT